MNRLSVMVESSDYLKSQNDSETRKPHSGSLSDLTQKSIGREDSIISKSSLSLFFKKSVEGSWSNGSISTSHFPRPDKALVLFDKVLSGLNEMFEKYSQLTTEDGIEHQDYNEICTKIDDRMMLVQTLKADYLKLLEMKKEEYDKIQSNLGSILKNKNSKVNIDLEESEPYWTISKELFIIESKLEKCTGKLQFQIMDLDSVGKINSLDQYELSIRLNDTTKFKSRIKIEKTGHQLWDMRNFEIYPIVDDYIYIKFSELKPLNKSSVLIEKKLPFVNEMIRSSPSIFTMWLTPVGTIKLKVIVQWNAILDKSNLHSQLISSEEVPVRSRASSTSHNRTENNIHSISNILEDVDEEKKSKEAFQNIPTEIKLCEESAQKTDNDVENINKDLNIDIVPENLSNVQINVSNETTNLSAEKLELNSTIVLLRKEKIDLSFHNEDSPNEKIVESISEEDEKEKTEENGKEKTEEDEKEKTEEDEKEKTEEDEKEKTEENGKEKTEEDEKEKTESSVSTQLTLSTPLEELPSEYDPFESSLVIPNEDSNNQENEEIIIDQDAVYLRSIENPSENLTNEIEVEIIVDSSEIDSTGQNSSDNISQSNSDIQIKEELSGSLNHESYTVDSVDLSEDSELAVEIREIPKIDNSESTSELTAENVACTVISYEALTDSNINSGDPAANH